MICLMCWYHIICDPKVFSYFFILDVFSFDPTSIDIYVCIYNFVCVCVLISSLCRTRRADINKCMTWVMLKNLGVDDCQSSLLSIDEIGLGKEGRFWQRGSRISVLSLTLNAYIIRFFSVAVG